MDFKNVTYKRINLKEKHFHSRYVTEKKKIYEINGTNMNKSELIYSFAIMTAVTCGFDPHFYYIKIRNKVRACA